MKYILISIILLGINLKAFSQFYETGEVPITQRYHQIKTEHYKLVFPEGLDDYAKRMANIMEHSYANINKSLGHNPKRIPILLNNTSVQSNGYVSWAPKRMEVITTPTRNAYSQVWLNELVLHESRHVTQIDKMNQGITKVMNVGFGQMITGSVTGMLPFWFLEGDAVNTETGLSESGRGRDPYFQSGWRAILLENDKRYSYEKAYYGSYKDYVPDFYELGYQLTAYARKNYGNDIWDNVLDHVGRNPYQIYPFYFGLKKYAQSSKVKLYDETMDYIQEEWKTMDSDIKQHPYKVVNSSNKKVYTSYRKPIAMDNKFFIVEKTSLSDINTYIIIDDKGNERELHSPGFSSNSSLSYANGKIVWDEIALDPLWPKKSYSVIKIFDISTNIESKLTSRTRYFQPDISPDGKKIVCVESDLTDNNFLVILDAETGSVSDKIKTPENKFPQNPRWDKNSGQVVMTLLGETGLSIEILDLNTKDWNQVIEPTHTIISKPRFFKSTVLFNGAFSGTNNIYSADIQSKEIQQVTDSRFGAYDAYVLPNENQMVYSNYTSNGYDLHMADYNPELWKPFNQVEKKELKLYENIYKNEDWVLNTDEVADQEFEIKKYNKLLNLIGIHSWAPFYADYEDLDFSNPVIYPGVQLFFQNLLSTSIGSVGYSYQNKNHFFNITYDYKGTRPAIQYSMEYGGDVFSLAPFDSVPATNSSNISNNVRLYFPLDLTNNRYSERFTPFVEAKFYNFQYYDFKEKTFAQNLNFVEYGLLYYRLLKRSHRDIRSKFGQVLQVNYISSPNDNDNYGSLFRAFGTLYLPGFGKNHSIKLQANHQEHEYVLHQIPITVEGQRRILNIDSYVPFGLTYPRGINSTRLVSITGFSGDYALPILYPDLNIGRLAYITRITLNGFWDYSRFQYLTASNGNIVTASQYVTSYGLDIMSDMNLFHFIFPLNMGIRLGYETLTNSAFTEFLFGVDIGRF